MLYSDLQVPLDYQTDFLYTCKEPSKEIILVDYLLQLQISRHMLDTTTSVYMCTERKKKRSEGRKAGDNPCGLSITDTDFCVYISSVQLLSCVRLFATPWTAARQASAFLIVQLQELVMDREAGLCPERVQDDWRRTSSQKGSTEWNRLQSYGMRWINSKVETVWSICAGFGGQGHRSQL